MSVVRGRPPGLAGGISGASRAYCSSLKACPAPKSPTSARLSIVHMACLQEGLFPPEPPGSSAGTAAHPNEVGFSNGLSAVSIRVVQVHAGRTSLTRNFQRQGLAHED